jgi:ADP-ribosylglycohydrolase
MEFNAINVTEKARKESMGSKSNGVLMRIAPLCIWGYQLDDESFEHIIRMECELTHPDPMVFQCSVAYGIMIRYLLNRTADTKEEINEARTTQAQDKPFWFLDKSIKSQADAVTEAE